MTPEKPAPTEGGYSFVTKEEIEAVKSPPSPCAVRRLLKKLYAERNAAIETAIELMQEKYAPWKTPSTASVQEIIRRKLLSQKDGCICNTPECYCMKKNRKETR